MAFFLPIVVAVVAILLVLYWRSTQRPAKAPAAYAGRYIPFFGAFLNFARDPVAYVTSLKNKYGGIFTVRMVGQNLTYLINLEGQQFFFKATDEDLSPKDAYQFMTPIFGKGVVYDAPPSVMVEQVKFARQGLSAQRLQLYVPKMVAECEAFFRGIGPKLGDQGKLEILESLADLTILTASKCLLGDALREKMGNRITQLYHAFDAALNPIGMFWPNLPLPVFKARDAARLEMVKTFTAEIEKRRRTGEIHEDMLQTLMESTYKDGSVISDEHICGMLTALLFAGQHTSSITATWTGLELMNHPEYLQRVLEEQKQVLEKHQGRIDFDALKDMVVLHRAVTETLRLHPPLIFLMRRVMRDMDLNEKIRIPKGDMVVVAPGIGHLNPEVFSNPEVWEPDRFERGEHLKHNFGWFGFGGGRHGCIGEQFGLLQVKTIWTVLLRDFKFDSVAKIPLPDYSSMVVGPKAPVELKYTRINVNPEAGEA